MVNSEILAVSAGTRLMNLELNSATGVRQHQSNDVENLPAAMFYLA